MLVIYTGWQQNRYSILPTLSLSGILYVSILEGSFTSATFAQFIEQLLDQMNPYLGPNSIVVMDNCAIHKCPDILELIVERWVLPFLRRTRMWLYTQWYAIWIFATILTRLQPYWTCLLCNQGSPLAAWSSCVCCNHASWWHRCVCAVTWGSLVCNSWGCWGLVQ